MNSTDIQMKKPIQLRVIFLLNALMMFLPFVFYYVFTTKNISVAGLDPILMVYTGIAYIISFGVLVSFILKKNIMGFRAMFLVNVLIAIPASAYIAIIVAVLSMLISFTSKVKAYFNS